MNLTDQQAAEVAKYEHAYAETAYGMGPARKQAAERHLRDWALHRSTSGPWYLLDIGCGRGEMLKIAQEIGFVPFGVDPATGNKPANKLEPGEIGKAIATDLPYGEKAFELVTCFDVMEHLLESDLVPALQEMRRVSSMGAIIAAADFPHKGAGGVDYHISARPNAEWEKLFRQVFPSVSMLPRYGGISATWYCR